MPRCIFFLDEHNDRNPIPAPMLLVNFLPVVHFFPIPTDNSYPFIKICLMDLLNKQLYNQRQIKI